MHFFYHKVLRGRWGSIEHVEDLLDRGGFVLGPVFDKLFNQHNATEARRPAGMPTAAHEEEHRETRRKWKALSGKSMASPLFQAILRISSMAKQPLTHFLHWALDQRSEQVKRRKQAEQDHEAAMCETMVSRLVTGKAAAIMSEISKLMSPDSVEDPHRWGKVWQLLAEHPGKVADATALMVSLVCTIASNWQQRFIDIVDAFPLRFLWCLQVCVCSNI